MTHIEILVCMEDPHERISRDIEDAETLEYTQPKYSMHTSTVQWIDDDIDN